MHDFPRTVRFSIDDKADWVYYQSKFNKKQIDAINYSANEAARRITSNADLNTTRELIGIENAAHEIAQSQIAAAFIIDSSIQASTNKIVAGQYMIADSIGDLKALFDTRSAEIIWQLEQQRKELKEILEKIYKAIVETDKNRAKAKKEDGIEAYNNRWFDEAIKDFNESIESYSRDFVVYQFLGNIYLFEKKDPKKAIDNYKLALKYAEPYNEYYTSLASLHIGLSHYDMGNFQDAYDAALNAIQKNPDFSEAHYRCAQYCSKLGRHDEAINYLRTAINADRGYSLKALAEDDFTPMSGKFKNLMEDLTREEKSKADKEIEKSNYLIKKFDQIGISTEVKEKLEEGISLISAGTYLNYRDAKYKAKAAQKALVDSLTFKLSSEISKAEPSLDATKNRLAELTPQYNENKRKLAIFFTASFFCGGFISFLNYADDTMNLIYLTLWIGFLIGTPFFLYHFALYISMMREKNSYIDKLKPLEKTMSKILGLKSALESEKSELNIDESGKTLTFSNYEKYLRKTYG